jgi:hypothetical protein
MDFTLFATKYHIVYTSTTSWSMTDTELQDLLGQADRLP